MGGLDIESLFWFAPCWSPCALAQKVHFDFLIYVYNKDVGQGAPLIINKLALKMS